MSATTHNVIMCRCNRIVTQNKAMVSYHIDIVSHHIGIVTQDNGIVGHYKAMLATAMAL